MKTKKIVSILLLILMSFNNSFSQTEPDENEGEKVNVEKIKTLKKDYFTEKLNLTPQESSVFWPVYNDYSSKKMNLRKENRNKHKAARAKAKLTNEEMEVLVDAELEFKIKMLEIDKEFHQKIKTILPIEKVLKLYKAEHAFKKEVMHKIKKEQTLPK